MVSKLTKLVDNNFSKLKNLQGALHQKKYQRSADYFKEDSRYNQSSVTRGDLKQIIPGHGKKKDKKRKHIVKEGAIDPDFLIDLWSATKYFLENSYYFSRRLGGGEKIYECLFKDKDYNLFSDVMKERSFQKGEVTGFYTHIRFEGIRNMVYLSLEMSFSDYLTIQKSEAALKLIANDGRERSVVKIAGDNTDPIISEIGFLVAAYSDHIKRLCRIAFMW